MRARLRRRPARQRPPVAVPQRVRDLHRGHRAAGGALRGRDLLRRLPRARLRAAQQLVHLARRGARQSGCSAGA